MYRLGLTIALLLPLLLACQSPTTMPVLPTATVTRPAAPSLWLPTPTPTENPPTPTLTPAVTRKAPTSTPLPSRLEVASEIFAELDIFTERRSAPDGQCYWEQLTAYPRDRFMMKYEGKFFVYAAITCFVSEELRIELVNQWTEMGLGYAIPVFLGWSTDQKKAYFYDAIIPDGCQPLGGFQRDLRQVDLRSGDIQLLALQWTGGLTLSPDATQVVYYDYEKAEVGLYDLLQKEELRIPIPVPPSVEGWYAGNFIWSPDGLNILFLVQYGDPCFPVGISIRKIDRISQKMIDLGEIKDQAVSLVEWSEPQRVQVIRGGELRYLDPNSGEWIAP